MLSTFTITSFAISKDNGKNNEFYEENIENNEKTTKTLPAVVSQKKVLKRIEELNDALGGKYFTINRESCGAESNHGCSNCGMLDVVDTKWFQKAVGFSPVNRDYYPHHYFMGHKYTWGMSCCGFAGYAGWYIYAQKETDNVVFNNKGTKLFNEDNVAEFVEPGDILRLDGRHSAVYISHNSEGVIVLDCNWRTDGTNCEVRKHIIEYDNYRLMGISRALNHVGESSLRVKVVNPDVPSETQIIPFREGESVSLLDVKLSKVGHYQTGWAKKPNKTKAKFGMDEEFTESITLYPVWKEYDNQRLVVVGFGKSNNTLFLQNRFADFALKVIGEMPVGTQEEDCLAFPVGVVLSQKQLDACIEGNKKNKKYIVVFVKENNKKDEKEIVYIRYEDEFDYEKFGQPKEKQKVF